jgi:hypothetical protein
MTRSKAVAPRVFALLLAGWFTAGVSTASAQNVTPSEAKAIGEDAYIYGYPLVTMDMTRQLMTNVVGPEGLRAPMGQFINARD